MGKNNNLQDFMTDLANAIREKKGTTDKINPQDFSDEIKSIKTSTSMWTGHVDVEGLKAIGWDDDDIAYFQEHGVNWMEEDDEYHKVSDDNKALYGVLTADNIQEYKDRIVWLPKIDTSHITNLSGKFSNLHNMVAIPLLNTVLNIGANYMFSDCHSLTCIPPLNMIKVRDMAGMFSNCTSLSYVPKIVSNESGTASYMFYWCRSLKKTPEIHAPLNNTSSMFSGCSSLVSVGEVDMENVTNSSSMFFNCFLATNLKIKNIKTSVSINNAFLLTKESLLYMVENEAATSAITITLSSVSYNRLSSDPDIVTALSNHPLVSLASA